VKTLKLAVDPSHSGNAASNRALDQAAEILRGGGLVAFPTETVYGLGANALDGDAVAGIFVAKERPAWDPVIVHIASAAMLEAIVDRVPESAKKLIAACWPGPLTLLLPRSSEVPDAVTAGRALVGVRMPAHPVALELIRRAGVPIAAPSANTFGHVSPTTAEHVLEDLDGRIDAILDAGPTLHGVESTVLDPCRTPMIIYRPGAVTAEQIAAIAGPVELFQSTEPLVETPQAALPSPGVGLRHYAPRARLILVDRCGDAFAARLAEAAASWPGEQLGVMLPSGEQSMPAGAITYPWGDWSAPEELARNLYAALRALDNAGCTVIVCPLPAGEGIAAAIRDRLRKAAYKA
jgi:L-threonylcarbamoyladenylate synthase